MSRFGYQVDRDSGRVNFHYDPQTMTPEGYEEMRRIEEEAVRARPMTHGDAKDILAALARIEELLRGRKDSP